ncbi:hypothetical protein MXB_3688 [Myxobolus squamalis]|nr:hypothetical protein MXB_3688 [Myxobolus squamalis]
MCAVHSDQPVALIDLWMTPNDIYFNICQNTATLFDSAAFTIPHQSDNIFSWSGKYKKLNSRWGEFLEVPLEGGNLETKPSNFAMVGTSRIALHLFYEALAIMTFDRAMYHFVPCMYASRSGIGEKLYLRLFHEKIDTLDWV